MKSNTIFLLFLIRLAYATKIIDFPLNTSSVLNPVILPINAIFKSNEITLCLQFKIEETKDELFLLHDNSTNFELDMKFTSDYGFFRWNHQRYIFKILEEEFHPFAWYHFCFTMDGYHYSVIVNGLLWFTDKLDQSEASEVSLHSIHLAEIPKGKVQKGVSISRLNIWSHSVPDDTLVNWSLKCDDDLNGGVFSWNTVEHPINSIMEWVKTEIPSKVCHNMKETVVRFIPERLPFESSMKTCYRFGGEPLLSFTEQSKVPPLTPSIRSICNVLYWSPIHKTNKEFWQVYDQGQRIDVPWDEGEPNGNKIQNCALYHYDSHKYWDMTCQSPRCTMCLFGKDRDMDVHFKLRGLCSKDINVLDHQYILVVNETFNDYFVFKGYKRGILVKNEAAWTIYDVKSLYEINQDLEQAKVLAVYEPTEDSDPFPFGTKEWFIPNSRCNSKQKLKFTQCIKNMFTCDDGDCIPLGQRCDHVFDCQDQSDEHECNPVTFNQGSYLKNYPPMSRESKAQIRINISISDIGDIDELKMKFGAELRVSLTWRDSRLTFFNLIDDDDNLVSLKMMDKLWVPKLEFDNVFGSNLHLEHSSMSLQKTKVNGEPIFHTFLHEGKQYDGKDIDITLTGFLKDSFSCTYTLQNYPFDTQVCRIVMKLHDNVEVSGSNIRYLGEKQLVQFRIQEVDIEVDNKSFIVAKIVLKRIPLYHIFTTYIPTACILIMALVTLYIDEQHFEATIMVALTSMLVMYTLFQSIAQDMPSTAYLKLLDYWLIFGLVMPFIIFIIEVLWELIRVRNLDLIKPIQTNHKKNSHKLIIQVGLPVFCTIFVFVYICTALIIYYKIY